MNNALKIQVKNGRISLDEPTELPEGTIIELTPKVHQAEPNPKQLLWDEIKALYPDQWVALVDLLYDQPENEYTTKQLIGGVVFAHDPTRKGLSAKIKEPLAGQLAATLFTGKILYRKY